MIRRAGANSLGWRGDGSRPRIAQPSSRQFSDSKFFKIHRRALRLQAEITAGGPDIIPTRHFLSIHPEANFAVDAAHIIVVPLANSLAQILRRKTPRPIRRDWREVVNGGR